MIIDNLILNLENYVITLNVGDEYSKIICIKRSRLCGKEKKNELHWPVWLKQIWTEKKATLMKPEQTNKQSRVII